MKDRIAHIMRAKNLKASDFAELLGIQPSGISHILSGRNQPSLDFVKKIKETFPEYNLDWIVFGKGPMTTSEPFMENRVINPPQDDSVVEPVVNDQSSPSTDLFSFDQTSSIPPSDPHPPVAAPIPSQGVKTVFIMYDDGTFERFTPR